MKRITIYIILILSFLSLSASGNSFNRFFDTKDINRIVEIDGTEYYEYDFDWSSFDVLAKNSNTFNNFFRVPLKEIYGVDIKSDTILCVVSGLTKWNVNDTITFNRYLKNSKKFASRYVLVNDDIYIPVKKDIKFKQAYRRSVSSSVASLVFANVDSYRNEINDMKGSSNEEYKTMLTNRALEFYKQHDEIEDVIMHITLYIHHVIEFDEAYINNQFDIKKVLDDRKGVCASYTALFSTMIDTVAKIDDRITQHSTMTFDSNTGGLHVCNVLEINGELYQHDVTWISCEMVDNKYGQFKTEYNYFLRKTLTGHFKISNYSVLYSSYTIDNDRGRHYQNVKRYVHDIDIDKYLLKRFGE